MIQLRGSFELNKREHKLVATDMADNLLYLHPINLYQDDFNSQASWIAHMLFERNNTLQVELDGEVVFLNPRAMVGVKALDQSES